MRSVKFLQLLVISVAALLSACGGGGGGAAPPPPPSLPPPPPPPQVADLSGRWFVQSSGMVEFCGGGFWLDGWVGDVTQTDDQISLLGSNGADLSGTVGAIEINLSGDFPVRNHVAGNGIPIGEIGIALVDMQDLTIGAGEDTIFASIDYLFTFDTFSCPGSAGFFLRRDGDEADTEPNNNTPEAQAINIITNDNAFPTSSVAGWVTGSVDLVTDEFDVFEFTIANQSTLEVELSHFDTTAADLDVYILDSVGNELAISDALDSWEVFIVDLDPGTYFIWVEAFVTGAATDYVLSVDLNEI